ncbi:hypothetical protein GCM10010277_87170 [Streptomyces longisporoflavus]|uniref:hypothetical protein n=1 Tax=Streptomyces longisporoflavus TaxID=28044 RepID=UPI0019ABF193|nr:hypothetical protein [Streptomyces longisporoflavus]GGV73423.1 hypothetical protein GCM10010277_87170 [Streptomyces longisporoflavus]
MCVDGVAHPLITAATGWPAGATAAAFSADLLISALAGIHVGRILDHRGPRTVMTTGSLIGTASPTLVATAPTWQCSRQAGYWPGSPWRPPSTSPPLLQATATTDRWGTAHYGRLSGLLAALNTAVTALAPLAGAALAVPLGGYPALLAVLAVLSVLGAASALGSAPTGRTRTSHERVRPKA